MSAKECLEHKWLCENQSLKPETNDINAADVTPNKCPSEQSSTNGDAAQILPNDVNNTRTSAGFFLHPHQSANNGTTSSLNEIFNGSFSSATHANPSASTTANNDHQHQHNYNHETPQPQHKSSSQHRSESLCAPNNADSCTNDSDCCLKQTATTMNNNCNSSNINCISDSGKSGSSYSVSEQNDLLKDYATNKENINLSKILVNRIAPLQNQPSTQLINNLNKGITLNNNHSNNNNLSSSCSTYDYADDILATSATTPQQSTTTTGKYETILFPDAPTTPKVSRKSETVTPGMSCVTLVKQFQLSNGTAKSTNLQNRIDFDEITVPDSPSFTASMPVADDCAQTKSPYRLSATTITAASTGSHHRSLTAIQKSSTLSINTVTQTTVGVESTSTTSTVTINCLCGADKTMNCCCNSRTALNYRKKSLAVVDSSILC